MLRVSIPPNKTRQEILSELMWVDDLKQFKQTICEPNVSLRGNLLIAPVRFDLRPFSS